MDINFHAQLPVNIRNRPALIKTIKAIFSREKRACDSLSIVFCTDDFLLNINQQFLQHDTYTDIISFNYASGKNPVIGELYISMERVRENAKLFNTSLEDERARVIFHGALHFCGFKDKTKAEQKFMRTKEDDYLKFYLRVKNK